MKYIGWTPELSEEKRVKYLSQIWFNNATYFKNLAKRLEYLNLEIKNKSGNILTLDKYKHSCYFGSCFKHSLHSLENYHYNSLVDLIINLAEKLESENNKYLVSQENLTKEFVKIKNNLQKLIENQDYIKEQNNLILNKIKKLEGGSSTLILEKLDKLEKIILS